MTMRVEVFDDYAGLSQRAAEIVIDLIQLKPNAVLVLPTGSTPIGFYDALVKSRVSLAEVTTFNLDEYVGLPKEHPQSYYAFMKEHLYDRTDLKPSRRHIPNGMAPDPEAECRRYEEAIRAAGGVDLAILGIGHNGHLGFNEPGSPWDSPTRMVSLTESTRQANARFFNSIDEVPTHALTMGMGTILRARRILLLANGAGKAEAIRETVKGTPRVEVPATALQTHTDVTVLLDREAASRI